MSINKRANKKLKKLPQYTTRGCPLTKNDSKWCFALCEHDYKGMGICGRVAPHSVEGRTQMAIRKYNEKLKKKLNEKVTTA